MNRNEVLESLQKRVDKLNLGKQLLSPIEGFHVLEEYEQGYDAYKKLTNPNAEDDRWAAHCTAIDSASIFESQAYLCKAIDRGNQSAKVDYTESLFWLGEFRAMDSMLETISSRSLTAFDQTKLLCIQSTYALGNKSVSRAKSFIEQASFIANFKIQQDKMLANYFYIFDILIHSKMGRKDQLKAKLKQLHQAQHVQNSQYNQFLSVFSLVLAGYFDEALNLIKTHDNVYRRENHYKQWFLGYIYWQQGKTQESVAAFEDFSSGQHPWEDSQKHLNLSSYYLSQKNLKLAKANLANAKISAMHTVDTLGIQYRENLIAYQQGKQSLEKSLDQLQTISETYHAMGHHSEEASVKLYMAELYRQIQHPNLEHELDDIYALSIQLQNPNLIQADLSFLPELRDIANQTHSEIASPPSLPAIAKPPPLQNAQTKQALKTLELNLLGRHDIIYDGQALKLSSQSQELLVLLSLHPEGLSGQQLSYLLYNDPKQTKNLKVAISKLRKNIPIRSQPYQLHVNLKADYLKIEPLIAEHQLEDAVRLYQGALLPNSDISTIINYQENLEESLRETVLASKNPDFLCKLASSIKDDLELWEAAEKLELEATKKAWLASKSAQTRQDWEQLS